MIIQSLEFQSLENRGPGLRFSVVSTVRRISPAEMVKPPPFVELTKTEDPVSKDPDESNLFSDGVSRSASVLVLDPGPSPQISPV